VYELRDHLTTALDAGYITPDQHKEHDRQAISVARLINGYIRATKTEKGQGRVYEMTTACVGGIGYFQVSIFKFRFELS
jgi:hypothetical protein